MGGPSQTLSRGVASLALLATVVPGCVDRAFSPARCGDGELDPDDVCFSRVDATLRAEFDPLAVRIADFDGDGHLDALLVGVAPDVTGAFFRGDGTGEFDAAEDARIHGCSAYPIADDIDGDGAADLLVSECGASALLFPGGLTGFGTPRSIATGVDVRTSSFTDLDGDGAADLVMLGTDAAGRRLLSVARGDGGRTFSTPASSPISDAIQEFDPYKFALGDIDGDGNVDALLLDTQRETQNLRIAPGLGNAAFDAASPILPDVATTGAWLRDFDHDGRLDIVARAGDGLTCFHGDGLGGFEEAGLTVLPDRAILTVGFGDVDLDGNEDLLLAMPQEPTLDVWRGVGDGTFETAAEFDVDTVPEHVLVADINEDGAPDLIVGAFSEGEIRVLLANP